MSTFEYVTSTQPVQSTKNETVAPRQAASSAAASTTSVSFSNLLGQAQKSAPTTKPPTSRWRSMGFLATHSVPRINWPWTYTNLNRAVQGVSAGLQTLTDKVNSVTQADFPYNGPAMALNDYPVPPGNNGRGIHWIPTVSQSPETVDRFVNEAVEMGMKWVLFLNDGTDTGANDYLVKKLTAAGIEPIMRIYTPGLVPVQGDLKKTVQHYKQLGVNYFQLYNEPNLMVETGGQYPNVDRYLDLWVPAAKQVLAGGGLPGFGALSPQGEMDDRAYLSQSLQALKDRGEIDVLNQGWLSMHNYTGPRALDDPDGFLRFRQYDTIIRSELGRQIPIIGTEGGTHITEHVSEARQVEMVTGAYKYMEQREPYNFAYTYWIIANGHDPAWNEHALIRDDGPTALAQALKNMTSNAS